jgi:hypothetical protein
MPGTSDAQLSHGIGAVGVEPDSRSAFVNFFAFLSITVTALGWILAGIFFVLGVIHILNGIPHGGITAVIGILLGLGAYLLPRLWA